MVINKVLTIDKVPEFIKYFLSSKYVAHWLGVRVPQIDEIREFAIENILDIDTRFLNIVFAEYQLREIENNFDDRIKVEDIDIFVKFIFEYYEDLEQFLAERDEFFFVELIFQVPFVWNSRFSKEEKGLFLLEQKSKYYATIRKNYVGRLILIKSDLEIEDLIAEDECIVQFLIEDNIDIDLFLVFPKYLKGYWVAILDNIIKASGYLIPFEISDC